MADILLYKDNRGFTLVELMVAVALAAIIIGATMTIAGVSSQTYRAQERVTDAQQGVRGAMDMMVRDIRMAGYDPMVEANGPLANNGIITATATRLTFAADRDASGGIDVSNEETTYDFTGNQLRVWSWGEDATNARVLIDNVNAMNFVYLDEDGAVTAGLNDIVMVVVNMTVRATDSKGINHDRTLTTRINCRNLRL